jgi:hypothetical protein
MSSGEGLVVFLRTDYETGATDIWETRADGAFTLRLTFDGKRKSDPGVSLDGRRIVFCGDPDGDGLSDIFMTNIDGSSPAQLTTSGQNWLRATWHPDCHRVVATLGTTARMYVLDVDNPPWRGGPQPQPIQPLAPQLGQTGGGYADSVGSVGSGTMLVLNARNDIWVEPASILLDSQNLVMVYTQGDACFLCGKYCGLAQYPASVTLSTAPLDQLQIAQSPQLLSPSFFHGPWTGETSRLRFSLTDTNREDNCGSYTLWLIPYPTWGQ